MTHNFAGWSFLFILSRNFVDPFRKIRAPRWWLQGEPWLTKNSSSVSENRLNSFLSGRKARETFRLSLELCEKHATSESWVQLTFSQCRVGEARRLKLILQRRQTVHREKNRLHQLHLGNENKRVKFLVVCKKAAHSLRLKKNLVSFRSLSHSNVDVAFKLINIFVRPRK